MGFFEGLECFEFKNCFRGQAGYSDGSARSSRWEQMNQKVLARTITGHKVC